MAGNPKQMRTSSDIAAHMGTNAVVVRRVLGRLREAGLLKSEKGHSGGWQLARAPEKITLADVYTGLEEQLIARNDLQEQPVCSVEHTLYFRIFGIMQDMEQTLIDKLASTTIAEISEAAGQVHPNE